MKILTNLGDFFSKNKKNIAYTLLFLVFLFCFNDFALAADEPKKEPDAVISALNGFLAIVSSLLGVLTMLIGLFLRPEWTSGSVIGLDIQLKTMWILISNVVYFIFAGIFVTIAFMNIIGHGDNYELKKALPKFIVGVLIVPFSWFFVQFILSISSILTVAVLSIPFDTFPDLDIKSQKIQVCDKEGATINLSKTGSNVIECKTKDSDKTGISIGEFIKQNDNGGLYSIMTIYTYGVMRLPDKGKLFSQEITKGVTSVWGLTIKAVFDLIFLVVYTLLLVALFLAFMSRGFALWFYVMFSPVFGLLHYFGKGKDGMGEGAAKKFNLTEFIGLAFVPVYVAAALSFGMLFLFVAGKGFSGQTGTETKKLVSFEADSLKIGNNVFTMPAGKTNDQKNKETMFGGFTGPIGAMLIEMLGLAVLWLAVMAALKQSSITANVTSPIAEFGDQIGKLMSKAPTYAPILPGGNSIQSLSKAGNTLTSIPEQRANAAAAPLQDKINKKFGVNTVDSSIMSTFNSKLANGLDSDAELVELRKMYLDSVEKYGHNDKNVMAMRNSLVGAIKNDKGDKAYSLKNLGISDFSTLDGNKLLDRNTNIALLGKNSPKDADALGLAMTGDMYKSDKSSDGSQKVNFSDDKGDSISGNIKVTITDEKKGIGNITVKGRGDTGTSYNFDFNETDENNKTFGTKDLESAVKLYQATGSDDTSFLAILKKLNFKHPNDLLAQVKNQKK